MVGARDTECADRIVHSLQRLLVSRATVILKVPMELYILYTDYWWLVPQRYRMRCQDCTLSTEITGVPCHGDIESVDGIVYSLHRLLVVCAKEIQNALTGLYTLYRDYSYPVTR